MQNSRRSLQSGAVSLFLVVFATLLITVVTVSFLRTMIQDQLQATNLDLSQSAYDAAQAGVQDAERALLRYLSACTNDAAACSSLQGQTASWATECNAALASIVDTTGPEVKVQQSAGKDLNQAYTCVKIDLKTDDVIGEIASNETKIIPLLGAADFDTIQIDWFTQEDMGTTNKTVDVSAPLNPAPLFKASGNGKVWKSNKPSLLRAQLIQYGGSGFKLTDFTTDKTSDSNTNALFLYPSCAPSGSSQAGKKCVVTPSTQTFSTDARIDKEGQPLNVNCTDLLSGGGYACSQLLTLPNPIGGGGRVAYLALKPMYNATHFRVQLSQGGAPVSFNGVQAAVDSTGRANDIFRRVETRVDLEGGAFPLPTAAIDVSGSFCKNFAVTNDPNDYTVIGTVTCTP